MLFVFEVFKLWAIYQIATEHKACLLTTSV